MTRKEAAFEKALEQEAPFTATEVITNPVNAFEWFFNAGWDAGLEMAAEIADSMAGFNGIVIKEAIRKEITK